MSEENNILSPEIIGITITYKEPVALYLRMVGIAEEDKLRQKLFGLTEEEKNEKSYQLNVDTLAALVVSPAGVENKDALFTAEAVRNYFAEKTTIKERIGLYAVRVYLAKLQPEIIFI